MSLEVLYQALRSNIHDHVCSYVTTVLLLGVCPLRKLWKLCMLRTEEHAKGESISPTIHKRVAIECCCHDLLLAMFLETIQSSVNVGDYIKFSQSGSAPNSINNVGYGEIIEHLNDIVTVKLFKVLSSEVLRRYFIRPLTIMDNPLAFQDNLEELYVSLDVVSVSRSNILDVIFVVPVAEVESGMFYLSGANNVFCIRYQISADGRLHCFPSMLYFARYMIEPLCVRLFNVLNTLSQYLR